MKIKFFLFSFLISLLCFSHQYFFISSIAVQPDGKILVGGFFQQIGGYYRNNIARLNPNGSLDHSFVAETDDFVYCIAIQQDGKIIIGGEFKVLNGRKKKFLARLNPNGTTDNSFYAEPNGPVYSIILKKNGKILIGGNFTRINDYEREGVATIDQAGMVDTLFNTKVKGYVYTIAIQEDEKIIIGGRIRSVNGVDKDNIARLYENGELDLNFKTAISYNAFSISLLPDGKILVGGCIDWANGKKVNNLIKLDQNGALDETFMPEPDNCVNSIQLKADGKILVGGHFSNISGKEKKYLAMLMPDGSLDDSFDLKLNDYISDIFISENDKIYIIGEFSKVDRFIRKEIAAIFDNGLVYEIFNANTFVKWIQVGTHSKGGFGSFWKTDFTLKNTTEDSSKTVTYLHYSNGDIANFLTFNFRPNENIFIKDLFGILNFEISGAIEVISSQDFSTEAIIYNETDLGSFFYKRNLGQYFIGYDEGEAIQSGARFWLYNLKENESYRTNLHFTNIGRKNAILDISLFINGNLFSKFMMELKPAEYRQYTQIFKYYGVDNIENGSIRIINYSFQPVLASASVIENSTNNGQVVLPQKE